MDYYHDPDQRQTKELAPGVQARTFWGEALMLAVVTFDPNSAVPPHQHPHEQAGMVLSGEIQFVIAGETKLLHAGDVYLIPGRVEHSAKSGKDPATVLDIFTPVREDLKY